MDGAKPGRYLRNTFIRIAAGNIYKVHLRSIQKDTVADIKRLLFNSCCFIHNPDKRINNLMSKLFRIIFRFVYHVYNILLLMVSKYFYRKGIPYDRRYIVN